jgi:hypothetical protein
MNEYIESKGSVCLLGFMTIACHVRSRFCSFRTSVRRMSFFLSPWTMNNASFFVSMVRPGPDDQSRGTLGVFAPVFKSPQSRFKPPVLRKASTPNSTLAVPQYARPQHQPLAVEVSRRTGSDRWVSLSHSLSSHTHTHTHKHTHVNSRVKAKVIKVVACLVRVR